MQISSAQTIGGIKATTLRDALRRIRENHNAFSARMLAQQLKLSDARALIEHLLAEEMLERTGDDFKLTKKG